MSIIVDIDYNTALMYKGKSVTTKHGNKKHKVYFRLCCDDFTLKDSIDLARVSKNVLMLNYIGSHTNDDYLSLTESSGTYIGRVYEFGNNITEEDIKGVLDETPEGVVPIIQLQSDFTDLRFVWCMSTKYERLRFTGGKLFCIDGCRIGSIGIDTLDKLGIKYNVDSYVSSDALEIVKLEGLVLECSDKPERISKAKKTNGNRSKNSSSKPKKQALFSSFLQDKKVDL